MTLRSSLVLWSLALLLTAACGKTASRFGADGGVRTDGGMHVPDDASMVDAPLPVDPCTVGRCSTCGLLDAPCCTPDGGGASFCLHVAYDCDGARCACRTVCDGTCVDEQTNAAHCGVCGNACAADEECAAGACQAKLPPPSCALPGPGRTDCPGGSCCASPLVTGGTFYRRYDGTAMYSNMEGPATVSDFRLDKYEITVGRFRQFVAAVVGGWTPDAGAGRHTHLSGGLGLTNVYCSDFEPGWDPSWDGSLPATTDAWTTALSGCGFYATWTPAPGGANERQPINCLDWYKAEAFCIWDGGFLPSELEWSYAAVGGAEQRAFPWSAPPTSTAIDDSHAVFCGGACDAPRPVGSTPLGDGRFLQSDLAGNLTEWQFDPPVGERFIPCIDCVSLPAYFCNRFLGGGDFSTGADRLRGANSGWYGDPLADGGNVGARCARRP